MKPAASRPRLSSAFGWLLLVSALTAGALRFPALALRPMHADEAILADKTGTLIERGEWHYDPVDFHGPVLSYFGLAAARVAGARTYVELNETVVRAAPALCGFLLVLAPLLIVSGIGRAPAAWAILLAAVSPAMVFYSRYYIPETLLVLFSFAAIACGWRGLARGKTAWSAAAGVSAGLALAAKETAVLHFAAMALAAAGVWLAARRQEGPAQAPARAATLRAALVLGGTAALSAGLVLTSFGRYPGALAELLESLRTIYLERAFGPGLHVHPWHYYLGLLAFFHEGAGPRFSEAAVLLLAAVGTMTTLLRKGSPGLPRFLALYSLLVLAIYSLIPYKTPWCLLGFLQPMTVMAGLGAAALIEAVPARAWRAVVTVILAVVSLHLGWQAWLTSFRLPADPRNPYVYAHTGVDVFLIRDRVEALAAADPRGHAMPMQIFSRSNLWPLPWYFRSFRNVEWWRGVPERASAAPVILTTPDMEGAVATLLYERRPPGQRELYMSLFDRHVELRPAVEIRGYAAKSLWDRLTPTR